MKNKVRAGIVLAVIFVVYTVLTFALPFAKTAVLWLSYLFGVIAIAAQFYVLHTAFAQGESAKSKFYGFPIAKLGALYLICQLTLGLIFMALAAIVPVWLPAVLYVVLLGAAAVGFVAADTMRDEVERQDSKLKTDTTLMRTLQVRAAALAERWESGQVKMRLQALAENLRYSDPVSNDATQEIEQKLVLCLDELERVTSDEETSTILQRVEALLSERNQLCRLSKG